MEGWLSLPGCLQGARGRPCWSWSGAGPDHAFSQLIHCLPGGFIPQGIHSISVTDSGRGQEWLFWGAPCSFLCGSASSLLQDFPIPGTPRKIDPGSRAGSCFAHSTYSSTFLCSSALVAPVEMLAKNSRKSPEFCFPGFAKTVLLIKQPKEM